MSDRPLRISVALGTRNRPEHALACARSILANTGFEQLFVIDQSDGAETERAMQALNDARISYVHTNARGVTRSRNLGAELAGGDVVAFTDDDCRVAPDWIPAIARIFESDPEVAVVCGAVRVADAVKGLGFTENFEPDVREWQGRYPPFGKDWGITANLAVRLSVLPVVGKFDPMLGAGAPLISGGEPDFLFRVLRAGHKIVNAREVWVDHLGVRSPGEASRKLIRGYAHGTGAALFKHIRLGDSAALGVYLDFIAANGRRVGAKLIRGQRPDGLGYLLYFLGGSLASLKYRVDRTSRQYVQR